MYAAFFQFHSDFTRWSDERKASDVRAAATLDDDSAVLLKIDRGDLGKLTGVTNAVMADFKKIDREVKEIVSDAAEFAQDSPEPDPSQLYTDVLKEA